MTKEEVLLQVMELRKTYDGLYYDGEENTCYRIYGNLEFKATFNQETIVDVYETLILVPKSYPLKVPVIKEEGNRIPRSFHTNPDDTLCLEAPIKLYIAFNKNPTLLHFIESCALPFFYSYSYFEKNGELPFGDRSHGGEGLLEMYKEYFQLKDNFSVAKLIKILAENNYKGSNACPCQSGKKLHRCHGPQMKKIQHLQGSKYYAIEYVQIIEHLHENNVKIKKDLFSKTAYKKARKLLR